MSTQVKRQLPCPYCDTYQECRQTLETEDVEKYTVQRCDNCLRPFAIGGVVRVLVAARRIEGFEKRRARSLPALRAAATRRRPNKSPRRRKK